MNGPPNGTPGDGRPSSATGRSTAGRLDQRGGRSAILAVWLSVMILVSLFGVPAAAADAPGRSTVDGGSMEIDLLEVDLNESEDNTSSDGDGDLIEDTLGLLDGTEETIGTVEDTTTETTETVEDTATATTETVEEEEDSDGEGKDGLTVETSDGRSSTVNVAVSGVEQGQTVTVNVSTQATLDDEVALDAITAEIEPGGSFTLNITASRDPLVGSPAFETNDGTDALGRIRLEHSISNDDVDDVSLTFRLSKQRLEDTGTDLEEVALYRYADGTWTPLPTEPVGETETHYIFEVQSPGMSEFAVGALRPDYELWSASVDTRSASVGETIAVTARFSNVGLADGIFVAELVVDGRTVERQLLTVAGGGTRQATFHWTPERPGTYEVIVNDVQAGTVTITPAEREGGRTVLTRVAGWVTGHSLASLGEWVGESGRYAFIGLVPNSLAALLG